MYAGIFLMSFLPHMSDVKARNNFESTRAEVERLMKRIRSAEEDFKAPSNFTMEGYLYIQEKREILYIKTYVWCPLVIHYPKNTLAQGNLHENVCHVL